MSWKRAIIPCFCTSMHKVASFVQFHRRLGAWTMSFRDCRVSRLNAFDSRADKNSLSSSSISRRNVLAWAHLCRIVPSVNRSGHGVEHTCSWPVIVDWLPAVWLCRKEKSTECCVRVCACVYFLNGLNCEQNTNSAYRVTWFFSFKTSVFVACQFCEIIRLGEFIDSSVKKWKRIYFNGVVSG